MTAVPPPVPPEIVEQVAKALHEAVVYPPGEDHSEHWTVYADVFRGHARKVLAAVYGDIVEAARRDALTEAVGAILRGEAAIGSAATNNSGWIAAACIVTDLRDATAPRTAPAATVSDQGAVPRIPGTDEAQIGVQSDD